jgi:hypothetical protein
LIGKWEKIAVFEGKKSLFWDMEGVSELLEASRWKDAAGLWLEGICEWE